MSVVKLADSGVGSAVGFSSAASGSLPFVNLVPGNEPAGTFALISVYHATASGTTASVTSLTDDQGHTYTLYAKGQYIAGNAASPAGTSHTVEIWYAIGAFTTGTLILSATLDHAVDVCTGSASLFSGVYTPHPYDAGGGPQHSTVGWGSNTGAVAAVPAVSNVGVVGSNTYLVATFATPQQHVQGNVTFGAVTQDYATRSLIFAGAFLAEVQQFGKQESSPVGNINVTGDTSGADTIELVVALTGDAPPPTRSFGSVVG